MNLIKQLREALSKTTEGEWKRLTDFEIDIPCEPDEASLTFEDGNHDVYYDCGVVQGNEQCGCWEACKQQSKNYLDFIVLAHNHMAELLDALEDAQRRAEAGEKLAIGMTNCEAVFLANGLDKNNPVTKQFFLELRAYDLNTQRYDNEIKDV